MIDINKTHQKSENILIPTTVVLIRAVQAVLVSVTHVRVVDAAVVGTQEVGRRACRDG